MKAVLASHWFDGTGAATESAATILIDDGRIVGIEGPDAWTTLQVEQIFDLRAFTVLPGLIDAHIHLSGRRSTRISDDDLDSEGLRSARAVADSDALLGAGFTTARDCGGPVGLAVKASCRGRLLAAGRFI